MGCGVLSKECCHGPYSPPICDLHLNVPTFLYENLLNLVLIWFGFCLKKRTVHLLLGGERNVIKFINLSVVCLYPNINTGCEYLKNDQSFPLVHTNSRVVHAGSQPTNGCINSPDNILQIKVTMARSHQGHIMTQDIYNSCICQISTSCTLRFPRYSLGKNLKINALSWPKHYVTPPPPQPMSPRLKFSTSYSFRDIARTSF